MWRYQYEDEVIDNKIAELTIKILADFDKINIMSEGDRQRLVSNCL